MIAYLVAIETAVGEAGQGDPAVCGGSELASWMAPLVSSESSVVDCVPLPQLHPVLAVVALGMAALAVPADQLLPGRPAVHHQVLLIVHCSSEPLPAYPAGWRAGRGGGGVALLHLPVRLQAGVCPLPVQHAERHPTVEQPGQAA